MPDICTQRRSNTPCSLSYLEIKNSAVTALLLRMLVHVEIDLLADAVEDVAVAFLQRGAGDDAPEGTQEGLGVALVRTEADLVQRRLQVFEKRFHFVDRREIVFRLGDVAHAGEVNLV